MIKIKHNNNNNKNKYCTVLEVTVEIILTMMEIIIEILTMIE
jgi:hypothetical protein